MKEKTRVTYQVVGINKIKITEITLAEDFDISFCSECEEIITL